MMGTALAGNGDGQEWRMVMEEDYNSVRSLAEDYNNVW